MARTTRAKRLQVAPPQKPEDELPPYEWDPRHYQQDALDARAGRTVAASGGLNAKGHYVGCNGWDKSRGRCNRFLLALHRRAGKDRFGLELIRQEMQTTVGSYWHLYPLQVQAKRAIWNAVDTSTETRLLELLFPTATRAQTNDQDLFIRFKDDNTYQLCGSDNYDRLVGANPRGVLLTEWALCDPTAWGYLAPILMENGGWAAFMGTYRGPNHMFQMVQRLHLDPSWYVDVRTIDTTFRANGSPVVPPEAVAAERAGYVALYGRARAEALIREEMYCDPRAALPGSVYGSSMASMIAEGRA